MAPLHHHFELKGWPEPRVIVRFWVITVVLVLDRAVDPEDPVIGRMNAAPDTTDTGRVTRAEAHALARPAGYVLVVGLGETGLSCIRHLAGHGRHGEDRWSRWTRERQPPCRRSVVESEFPEVELHCGRIRRAPVFDSAAEIVVSPGVSVREPALQAAAALRRSDHRRHRAVRGRAADAPVVAITGSNGKSTVTSLVAAMARRRRSHGSGVGGNLGPPALVPAR